MRFGRPAVRSSVHSNMTRSVKRLGVMLGLEALQQ
jgi:hypothetical protein